MEGEGNSMVGSKKAGRQETGDAYLVVDPGVSVAGQAKG